MGADYYSVPRKVILMERSKNKIVINYQDSFYCAGHDFYYKAAVDENNKTVLNVFLRAVNIMDGSIPGCDCPFRIEMEHLSLDDDLSLIEKVKIKFDFYWKEDLKEQIFDFEKGNCFFKGEMFEEGDTLTNECNLCTCSKYGTPDCDEMDCSSCSKDEVMKFICKDGTEVDWCLCTDPQKGWSCDSHPYSKCEN